MAVKRRTQPRQRADSASVFYAFKIGPISTGAGPLDVYVGMRDGCIAPLISGVSAAEAMRQLAKHGTDCALRCEQRLAQSGKKHGFEVADAPDWAAKVRCGLTVCMALGPGMGPDCMLPAAELVTASAKFLAAAPWHRWDSDLPMTFEVSGLVQRTYEGCIMGSGGQEFGIAMYEDRGAMAKLAKLHQAGRQMDAMRLKCIGVTFDPAPAFASEVLQQAIGAQVLPVPVRVERGGMGPPSAAEMLTLAAGLVATSGVTPSTPVGIGGVSDGRGSVTVKVTAPASRGKRK